MEIMNEHPISEKLINEPYAKQAEGNNLFPVFLKLESLHLLIVGGGNVGLEKLNAILNNAPATKLVLVATEIGEAVKELAENYPQVILKERSFVSEDLIGVELLVIATNDKEISASIRAEAKKKNILVNVADTPELCDFYLGSIVQKGNLKIAISTNGKSPTIAKRLKEVINEIIPVEIDSVLGNMHVLRNSMHGGFDEKVKQLNDITKVLVSKHATLEEPVKPA